MADDPVIIVYSCPTHGDLVEYDPPGPSKEHAPDRCWKRRHVDLPRGGRSIHSIECRELLVRSER